MPDLEQAGRILHERLGHGVRVGFPIAPLTTFRIGGPAALYVEAESDEALAAVREAVDAADVPVAVIGKGSNMLVSDEGFPGIVVRLGRAFRWAGRDGDRLSAGGAMPLPALAGVAMRHRLSGLEFGVAIPASVGGAVKMNAGAHGRSMSDVVDRVEVFPLTGSGDRRSLGPAEAGFAYRRSRLPDASIVVGATVLLEPAGDEEIRAHMEEAREWRRRTQPLAEPNCGSVFKNPDGDHAARLIESAGAKGLRVGGARVSEKHANFIVADPGATASDVWALIQQVRSQVEHHAGVRLETEVERMGVVGDADD
ncbi:MAG: UDP-N-acetylmuramate dehydrogenase [Actinomycetota bacterium]